MNEKFKSKASTSAGSLPEMKTADAKFFAAYPVMIGISLFRYRQPPSKAVANTASVKRQIFRADFFI